MALSTFDKLKVSDIDEGIVLNDCQLKDIQKVSLEILDDVISLCEEEHICYFLGGGSALGALRHKGFIPWDDDIDINIPRKDYDRFLPAFIKKYADRYTVQTPQNTNGYALSLTKIRKKGTVLRGRDDIHLSDCGIAIDIFVIENVFDNPLLRKLQGVVSLALGYLLSARKFYRDRAYWRGKLVQLPAIKKAILIKLVVGFCISFASVDTWCKVTDNWHRICKNDDSTWVCGCAGRLHFFGELYLRDDFCVTRIEEFEGRKVNVPVKAEQYLKHCYGDWMSIPPVEEREKHIVLELKY